jgi:putative hemolysin
MSFKKKTLAFSAIILSMLLIKSVSGILINPSMKYCEELGYESATIKTEEGEQGVCKFPDNSICEAWDFLKGKCGEKYNFCTKSGYKTKTISDTDKCSSIFSEECAVCVLGNKTEVEVSQLMKLDFGVGSCGDGVCSLGENYENCPEDCPSGSFDMYCDGVKDGICDPDCTPKTDSDCLATTTTTTTAPPRPPSKPIYIYLFIVVVIIAIIAFFLYKIRVTQ